MASLKIYFDAQTGSSVQGIKEKIVSDPRNIFRFNENGNEIRPGFYSTGSILNQVRDDYFISDYFEIDKKKLPTLETELLYFHFREQAQEKEERYFPILVKVIYNRRKGILCFFTKAQFKDKIADRLFNALRNIYSFNFRFVPQLYKFERDELDEFVNALNIKDFTAISIDDQDNEAILQNLRSITETEKFLDYLKQYSQGNWRYIKVPFPLLNFKLRINNTKSQKFITFVNKYENDVHLVKAVDYIISAIHETGDLSQSKQTHF